MPTWKAPLMNRAGRLTTVKVVMSSKCIHTIISLKVSDWVFQEIDKRRRGFLWAGKDKANGSQCLVAWPVVCRPPEFGGLGVPDLRLASFALRLRWLWLKRTDGNRPWKNLELDFGVDQQVQEMFRASIHVQVGDGGLALFWINNWRGADSPCITAPTLCQLVKPRFRNRRTVAEALQEKRWIDDISRQLTVQAIREYIQLWVGLRGFQLNPGREDVITWRWSAAATYSARSAYRMFF
ncbi:unnamed protein product [Urochloa decumbens]|uniref:Uncharacterized protein n=1 Tax=Urochloa decumbens TaxID=240449 RepID=A0ABC9B1C7_9POAL